MKNIINIFWFRRDLRWNDNAGLFHSLRSGLPVLPVFIFDKDILDQLQNTSDRRVTFIYHHLKKINEKLKTWHSCLSVFHGRPQEVFEKLTEQYDIRTVFANHDYESYATRRDSGIEEICRKRGIGFITFKDQVIFEKGEVVKDDKQPYTVFTPYSRKWKQKFAENTIQSFDTRAHIKNFYQQSTRFPELKEIGFTENHTHLPDPALDQETILNYHISRDFPYPGKTTHVSLHLRFGTLSIRELVATAGLQNEKYLNELLWREFLMQILWHFPRVEKEPFKKKYEWVKWRNREDEFEKWCRGETGFPLVDAGMRQLNETGWMHNRVRMVAANFLTKILFIDWRWGEAYFAEKLTDFELSSNNGNWQWAAGCGCDAAPYFRIFNPATQAERFDPGMKYISKWIPGYTPEKYIRPIIDFQAARQQTLLEFKKAFS